MNTLLVPLRELGEYEEIRKTLDKKGGKVSISGCVVIRSKKFFFCWFMRMI